jgi:hydrogenase-4 component E
MDFNLVFLVLTNLLLLSSSRLSPCISFVAIQGVALGVLALMPEAGRLTTPALVLGTGFIVLKGVVFPWLLARAIREAQVRREVNPFIGYTASVPLGILLLLGSFWLSSRLSLPRSGYSTLAAPTALFTILSGLFLIITRKHALSQVLGYLVMENGIFAFGVVHAREAGFLVGLGILLDVFVAVFVMGITIFHINREFDHIDTERLSALRDSEP